LCAELLYISVHKHIIRKVCIGTKIEVKYKMPRGDRTGPSGLGPRTGRAAGYCAGYPVPGFMNPVPGFGRGFGFGRGWGRGRGRGFRRGCWTYPPVYPYAYPPAYAYPPHTYPAAPSQQSPEDELAALEDYKKEIEEERASIEQEISDLENKMKELKAKLEQEKGKQSGQ
jgi:hypothetical protein